MHVVATAGHVDHGKSTLVRALTGSDPDRLEEEHRRGLSIELGYCWTTLEASGDCAFVDVPGHERFVPTMLSGVGPVPAVLLAVAADDTWMPQAAEHLAALDAFGVRHAVVAVTRSDLADPRPMAERARAEVAATGMAGAEVVPVSARTGAGLERLRHALTHMLDLLPAPDPHADVRLWVDRCFTVAGAGTVVTGTLQAGSIAVGDTLTHHDGTRADTRVRIRGMQTLGRESRSVQGVARVALRLGGNVPSRLGRGDVLATPDAWRDTGVVDVRFGGDPPARGAVLHVGAAAAGCHCRVLGDGHARLTLHRPLPLRVGDRALLREPGADGPAATNRIRGVVVLDPAPPSLRRRGASRARASRLQVLTGRPDLADELERRRVVEADLLRRIGVLPGAAAETVDVVAVQADGWLLDRRRVPALSKRLAALVAEHAAERPLDPGLSAGAAARTLGLPTPDLVRSLLPDGLRIVEGRVQHAAPAGLPDELEKALHHLDADLRDRPFRAPDAARMAELGLHRRAVAAAERAGRLLRLTDTVVLLPDAHTMAVDRLRHLPQPFTASQARECLDTTRRVALPLLELLDRRGLTVRQPDDRRRLRL